MGKFISAIKYLWSILSSPIVLLLVWVFKFRPFSLLAEKYNWNIELSNPETIKGAIDVAILLALYNIIGKIFSKIKRPVKIDVELLDPRDPKEESIVKYSFNDGLKRLKVVVKIDYNNNLFRFITTFGASHILEIHWTKNWLNIEIDKNESDRIGGIKLENCWKCNLTSLIDPPQHDTELDIPFYFSVDHERIRKGYIIPKIVPGNTNWFLKILISILIPIFVKKNMVKLEVILNKS